MKLDVKELPSSIEILLREAIDKISKLNFASTKYGSRVHGLNNLCTCSECNHEIRYDSNYCWFCGCNFATLGSVYNSNNEYQVIRAYEEFTGRTYNPDDIYLFEIILCDNKVDVDNEYFSKSALEQLQEKFIGKTGLLSYESSKTITARIFKTELVESDTETTSYGTPLCYVKAWAYMVRVAITEHLIKEIDCKIKHKCSISCSCLEKICNTCGKNVLKTECRCENHIKSINKIQDVYEWSFVVPPTLNKNIVSVYKEGHDL